MASSCRGKDVSHMIHDLEALRARDDFLDQWSDFFLFSSFFVTIFGSRGESEE